MRILLILMIFLVCEKRVEVFFWNLKNGISIILQHFSNNDAVPVFFDSLFPSYQSTTPESVISDYRNRTHHYNNETSRTRNNIEFYAEVFGKLIGTVRDGFSTLIDDVRRRKPNSSVNQTNIEMQTVEKLKNHTSTKIAKGNASMTNDSTDEIQSTQSLRLHLLDMKNDAEEQRKQQPMPTTWGNVIQKIAKNKLKRNDIESEVSLIVAPTNADDEDEKFDFFDDDDDEMMTENQKMSPSLLTALYERHRQRKRKLLASLCRLFSSEQHEELVLEPRNQDSKLTFAIMRGNSTVAQVTPKQFLGIFHRGSDEHAEFQKRAKRMLQEAFYKYARIYLRARKGYKDARNLNRKVRESQKTSIEVDHVENNQNGISSNARSGAQAIESFAIFVLEVFGAMAALTYGALNQIQNSSYDSLL